MRLRPSTTLGLHAAVTLLLVSPAGLESDQGVAPPAELSEVRLQHLAIGKTYSVTHMVAAPLEIQNTSSDTLSVHLEIEIPARHELRDGALPIPSRGWVRLERTEFQLAAGHSQRTDVHVSVPYDPDLAGNTYQVDFRSRMVDAAGNERTTESVHRLLFTVEMDYRDDTEAQFALHQSCSHRRGR